MIHAWTGFLVAAGLIGIGGYGVLARRNAVLLLIGVELMIAGAGLLLITAGATQLIPWQGGAVLTLFVITIAAAEIVLALAVIVAAYRHRHAGDLASQTGAIDVLESGR